MSYHVFLVLALVAAVLQVVLGEFAWFEGTAIAYAITGLLCGLVLRTRLRSGVARMLVPCFFAIGFAAAGVWSSIYTLAEAEMPELLALHGIPWSLVGFAATTPYLGRGRLLVPLVAAACFGAAGGLGIWLFHVVEGLWICMHAVLACFAAGIFDAMCERHGLESPEAGFDRLRIRLEFRLR